MRVLSLVSSLFLLTCAEATAQQTSQPPYGGYRDGLTCAKFLEVCLRTTGMDSVNCQSGLARCNREGTWISLMYDKTFRAGTGGTAARVAESCSTENEFCLSYCQSAIGVENCVQTCQQSRAMCMQHGVYAWKTSMRPTKTGLSRQ